MTEPALDSLLQALDNIDPRGQANDGDGRLPSLGNIKEVVEECLSGVCCKEIKLVNGEDDRLGCNTLMGVRNF